MDWASGTQSVGIRVVPTTIGSSTIEIPQSLSQQLRRFRNRVWSTKFSESILLAIFCVAVALLFIFLSDRLVDTFWQARLGMLVAAALVVLTIPLAVYRWIWKQRRPDQLARLLRAQEPAVGDQLLSAIELAGDGAELNRSRSLCTAAIEQVASLVAIRDLSLSAPRTRIKPLGVLVIVALLTLVGLWGSVPAAFENALSRFFLPLGDTSRFTFAKVTPLADNQVVPHGEPTKLTVRLARDTHSRPDTARLNIAGRDGLDAEQADTGYAFELPPLTQPHAALLRVGDYYQSLSITPQLRPQLIGAKASVQLPDYLQRSQTLEVDARSGKVAVMQGSIVEIQAEASRELSEARVNDLPVLINSDTFTSRPILIGPDPRELVLWWMDRDRLEPVESFRFTLVPFVDEAPTLVVNDLPRHSVVLDSEQLNFELLTADDFGIMQMGMSWRSLDQSTTSSPTEGDRVLSNGGPEVTDQRVSATFCAASLGIEAQPIELRCWAQDYKPGRERSLSSPHVLYVLNAQQHSVWVMEQMSKWHRSAIDVRDKELQLYEENQRLQTLDFQAGEKSESDQKLREMVQRQAALETANSRRLDALARTGEQLLRAASRNPEIGVGHLDRWAEILLVLGDISSQRMPSVAELLSKASAVKLPSISDSESSLAGPADESGEPARAPKEKKKQSGGRLSLPTTTIASSGRSKSDKDSGQAKQAEKEPQAEEPPLDEAVEHQAALLAEFERVADELDEVMANLEGSTLVKRLKAASREQVQVAQRLAARLPSVFGSAGKATPDDRHALDVLAESEEASREKVSYIMDDMQAYFERRRLNQFKIVLDEMKEINVLDSLTELGQIIPKKQGLSISQAEFWADSLDRWADDLVDPACSGQCPGCESSDALPPSLILEALRILEAEVNLREATRVAQQARQAVTVDQHRVEAKRLASTQDSLRSRTDDLVIDIIELPEGEQRFAKEVQLLSTVFRAMGEAQQILDEGDTGEAALAAETEAIELLLRCKRINPKAGGGGGSDPGGGGSGTTQDSALALLGSGLNPREQRQARDVTQATGSMGRLLPEEYRTGLDQYFNRLEQ